MPVPCATAGCHKAATAGGFCIDCARNVEIISAIGEGRRRAEESWVLILSRGCEGRHPETVVPGYATYEEAAVAGALAIMQRYGVWTPTANYSSYLVLPGRGAAALCSRGTSAGQPHDWNQQEGRKFCLGCGVSIPTQPA